MSGHYNVTYDDGGGRVKTVHWQTTKYLPTTEQIVAEFEAAHSWARVLEVTC